MSASPERAIMEGFFSVVNKAAQSVPFRFNEVQARLDAAVTGRDVTAKARKVGITSYFAGRNLARCISMENRRAVLIAHDAESTGHIFEMVHRFVESVRERDIDIQTDKESAKEITFPRTRSTFYMGTAGAREFGRGDTITDFHGSEVAFWPDPRKTMKGIGQAVPDEGSISLESTGNGQGNFFHNRVKRAVEGNSQYKLHFFPWWQIGEYAVRMSRGEQAALMADLQPEWEEPELVASLGLSAEQLLWRRRKLDELDYVLEDFKQEYPATLDECFQSSGASVLPPVHVRGGPWVQDEGDWNLRLLRGHPTPGRVYVMGVDVGGGVRRDNSVIEVLDAESLEQVAEWVSNRISPEVFAANVDAVGRRFNEAYCVVESNNHGLVTLDRLRGRYPLGKIYTTASGEQELDTLMKMGFRTTQRTRPVIVMRLRKALVNMTIYSAPFVDECASFAEQENGKLEANAGCQDDRVMAMAMAVYGLETALHIAEGEGLRPNRPVVQPFSLEDIKASIRRPLLVKPWQTRAIGPAAMKGYRLASMGRTGRRHGV